MTIILTDIDDTILNCGDGLQQFLEEECGLTTTERLSDHHNISKLYNVSVEESLVLVKRFHQSSWMARLSPLPCAVVVLPELYKRGYRFVAITACLNEPETVAARKANLLNVFGFEWEAIHCLGMVPSKRETLALYQPSIWIDDLAKHAEDGADLGHRSFLIDKPYNQSLQNSSVIRVKDWHEIAKLLG